MAATILAHTGLKVSEGLACKFSFQSVSKIAVPMFHVCCFTSYSTGSTDKFESITIWLKSWYKHICRRLTELALLYCQKVGDQALSEVGKGCKYLEALHLVDCSIIGDEAIYSIATGCRNLKRLHIRRCYEVLYSHIYTCILHFLIISSFFMQSLNLVI